MRRDIFQAMADPVRRDIIDLLSRESMTVNEVAHHFDVSRPAVSKHLRILNECGVIEYDQRGREKYCKIKPEQLVPAFMWIEQYKALWEDKIDAFESYLMKLKSERKKR